MENRIGASPAGPLGPKRDFPHFLVTYRAILDKEVRSILDASTPNIYPILHYHLGYTDARGAQRSEALGKALRPSLSLFTAEAVGGKWTIALPVAVALELIHNFSLVHDDIQDGDVERHGRPTVWALWGKPVGVMVGNILHALADATVLESRGDQSHQRNVVSEAYILTLRCLEMIQGQVLDLRFEDQVSVGPKEYLAMISGKTGALFDAALELGALAGGAHRDLARRLGRCGRFLGLAFQLQDDYLGVWGDGRKTGKGIGLDIGRRKKAFPAVYSLQQARGRDLQRLLSIYGANAVITDDEVAEVMDIMERVGAPGATRRLAEEQCQTALALVNEDLIENPVLHHLGEIATFLVDRQN